MVRPIQSKLQNINLTLWYEQLVESRDESWIFVIAILFLF